MKKIIFLSILIASGFFANAQFAAPPAPNSKKMTVEEANKLNGAVQPTINGVPYSQYKAQQEALKNKQQVASATAPVITTAKPATAAVDAQAAAAPATPKVTIEKPTGVQTAPDAKSALVPEAPKEPAKAEKGKG